MCYTRWVLVLLVTVAPFSRAELHVSNLGKEYRPDAKRVVIQQSKANKGGSTSIRNELPLIWKEKGYYQRNRDLGQVFTPMDTFVLEAIVLRTGPSDAAVLAGAPGAKVFMQFFEVQGKPTIDDNGTPPGTPAKHGFSKNHRCDDFIKGVTYKPIHLVRGGIFPDIPSTRDEANQPRKNQEGTFTYMRWSFTNKDALRLEAGKRYAFVLGFEEPGKNRGFTLANYNAAGVNAPPSLTDKHDAYHGGWGLRREGDGTLPPTMIPGAKPPADEKQRGKLREESLFAPGDQRYQLSPGTDGYPDVDTYRDLEFYIEAKKE
jgi:hypothetical protein